MAEAVYQYGDQAPIKVAAASAYAPGEVVVRPKGVSVYNGITTAVSGETVALCTRGVFLCAALTAGLWNDGDLVYWDATNNWLTASSGGNTLAGKAVGGKSSGETTATIDLNAPGIDT